MKRLAAALTLALVTTTAAACGGDGDSKKGEPKSPSSTSTTTTRTEAAREPQPVAVQGVGKPLRALIDKVYNAEDLSAVAAPRVARALADRKLPNAPVSGAGSRGDFKGARIAVVTVGQDVTLAADEGGWKVVGGWWPSMGIEQPYLGGARRLLAIGGDAREKGGRWSPHAMTASSEVPRSRADSLHIIGFDGQGGSGMLGLARDLLAELTTGGPKQKINGAMAVGGPEAQVATVQKYTGARLEGYILVGFNQFMDLIDMFGPLRIFVERGVQIFSIPTEADIPKGQLELDGETALNLARARKNVPGGDFGRSHQQGRIMLHAAAMAKKLGPSALPGILTEAAPNLWTDLSAGQMLTFVAYIYTLKPLQVPNKVAKGSSAEQDGRFVVIPDAEAHRLFQDIRDGNLKP